MAGGHAIRFSRNRLAAATVGFSRPGTEEFRPEEAPAAVKSGKWLGIGTNSIDRFATANE